MSQRQREREPEARASARPSLVDDAERVLRDWLAPGRHRPGDRLPPEHDLAAMLGVSRGTLRTALQRLQETGEIERRQGSGTFVGNRSPAATISEGLERLESYASLSRRRGIRLSVSDLTVAQNPLEAETAEMFGVEPGTAATTVTRIVLSDGKPVGSMTDTLAPMVELPSEATLRDRIERGDMILDVLAALKLPVAYSQTRIRSLLLRSRDRLGRQLGLKATTAMLELDEMIYLTSGEAVQHARDVFTPEGLDLRVLRSLDVEVPTVTDHARSGTVARRRSAASNK